MSRTVMVFGVGEIGGWALESLARSEGLDTLITADIREDWGAYRTGMVAVGSAYEWSS
ncbi:MAG: hypothetical protein HYX82_00555 [Chloroflexi bacterium]|nr:hypothetical protein [Chloroflexota bacterium]